MNRLEVTIDEGDIRGDIIAMPDAAAGERPLFGELAHVEIDGLKVGARCRRQKHENALAGSVLGPSEDLRDLIVDRAANFANGDLAIDAAFERAIDGEDRFCPDFVTDQNGTRSHDGPGDNDRRFFDELFVSGKDDGCRRRGERGHQEDTRQPVRPKTMKGHWQVPMNYRAKPNAADGIFLAL